MSSNLSAGNSSIIIVVSDFNEKVIENLLQGALDAFPADKLELIAYSSFKIKCPSLSRFV